jgi:hypothetical protein
MIHLISYFLLTTNSTYDPVFRTFPVPKSGSACVCGIKTYVIAVLQIICIFDFLLFSSASLNIVRLGPGPTSLTLVTGI